MGDFECELDPDTSYWFVYLLLCRYSSPQENATAPDQFQTQLEDFGIDVESCHLDRCPRITADLVLIEFAFKHISPLLTENVQMCSCREKKYWPYY